VQNNTPMVNFLELNLPMPSATLIQQINEFVGGLEKDASSKHRQEELYHHSINSVVHNFSTPQWLTQSIRQEYQDILPKHQLFGVLSVLENHTQQPACLAPHIDKSRAVGINCFLELGGSNVRTVWYDIERPIIGQSYQIAYDQVKELQHHVVDRGWYCFNTKRCHSVENIETRRVMMMIRLARPQCRVGYDFTYEVADFVSDYPHLITSQSTPI
jgi:hypothetical protein